MSFARLALAQDRPESLRRQLVLPRRQSYFRSPVDWRTRAATPARTRPAPACRCGARRQGIAYVEIRDLPPSEVLVCATHADAEAGAITP